MVHSNSNCTPVTNLKILMYVDASARRLTFTSARLTNPAMLERCEARHALFMSQHGHAAHSSARLCHAGPGCPDSYVLVTAGLLTTLLDFAHGAGAHGDTFGFLRAASLDRIVLLAHSAGGAVAMRLLSGLPAWERVAVSVVLHLCMPCSSRCRFYKIQVKARYCTQASSACLQAPLPPCLSLNTDM